MQNLIVSFNIVAPLTLYMLLGMLFRRVGLMEEAFTAKLNKLLMLLILPCNTFRNIYTAELSSMGGQGYVAYAVIGNAVILAVLILVFRAAGKEPGRLASIVQGSSRGNGVIFGIPLAESVFGVGHTATMTLMLAGTVTFYNIAHVTFLEICGEKQRELDARRAGDEKAREGRRRPVIKWKTIGKSLLKNGVLWGVVLGLLFNLASLPLPAFALSCINGLGSCVTPLAFMMVGAGFSLRSVGDNRRDLVTATLIKLVVLPLIFLAFPVYRHWPAEKLLAMLLAFGAPTAIISYPMAVAAGCDGELAGEIVAATVIFSMLSFFLWIFGFKQAGLM